jgi:hypothetical protein
MGQDGGQTSRLDFRSPPALATIRVRRAAEFLAGSANVDFAAKLGELVHEFGKAREPGFADRVAIALISPVAAVADQEDMGSEIQ